MNRRHDLDWLRVFAILALHLFHTGMAFNTWWWHVKNETLSHYFDLPMAFMGSWRMPLLFLISGIGTTFALKSRKLSGFIRERHMRLLLPVIAGMLIVIPPQVYYERLFEGQTLSFLEFYKTIFSGVPYPEGNVSWHHLWFVVYLFVYAMVSIPLLIQLRSPWIQKARLWMSQGIRIYYWVIPIAIANIALRADWPTRNDLIYDWANFTFHLVLFWLGLFIAANSTLWDQIEKIRGLSLWNGLMFLALLVVDDFLGLQIGYTYVVEQFLRSCLTLFWVLAILGYGKHYLHFRNRFLDYANEGIYPFYILHQTLIVAFAYYVVRWEMNLWLKFIVLALSSFLASWFLYETLIRRIAWIRPLFGLKPKKKPIQIRVMSETMAG